MQNIFTTDRLVPSKQVCIVSNRNSLQCVERLPYDKSSKTPLAHLLNMMTILLTTTTLTCCCRRIPPTPTSTSSHSGGGRSPTRYWWFHILCPFLYINLITCITVCPKSLVYFYTVSQGQDFFDIQKHGFYIRWLLRSCCARMRKIGYFGIEKSDLRLLSI